ncbi:MAG: tRNA pseudouridine(55) synthase TruB, partial [Candidatus Omnitrophica bacterium]|nr:tRNA pseudouridine(55) synthase TruB [Candidatus Omnitrophota bacterium]
MKKKEFRFNGVLNINKPAGMTSHDVVDYIRKIAKMRRVGHTGTLDPMATGVLPLCLGQATKIVQFLIAQDKEYIVEMKMGVVTDSQDMTGDITGEFPVPPLTDADILHVFSQFTGEIWQTPPMVSAKHHKGQRLYELARKGVEVEREP